MRTFIILGNDCNLQCVYCCQRQIKEKQIPRHISPKFWGYFHSLPTKSVITFFGGEPLLYFGAIKEIMSHRSDLTYTVITNGKLLDAAKVEYFNNYDIGVTVSWDGPCSNTTRGYDVLAENPHIKDIKNLCVSSVLTKWNLPSDIANTANKLLSSKEFGFNIDLPLNFTDTPMEFERIDTDGLYQDMYDMTDRFIHFNTTACEKSLILSILSQVQYKNVLYGNKCGNGTRVINIDLDGNFYNCHNESTPSAYTEEWDKTIGRQRNMCAKCDLLSVCSGGCSLMSDSATQRRCDIVHAYYEGVFDALLKNYGGLPC